MDLLEVGEIAELEDGKEFICIAKKELNGRSYVYLMSNYKPLEVRFATQYIENGELKIMIVESHEEKVKLLSLFGQN